MALIWHWIGVKCPDVHLYASLCYQGGKKMLTCLDEITIDPLKQRAHMTNVLFCEGG